MHSIPFLFQYMKQLLVLLALAIAVASCSKEDNEKPVITVSTPTDNQAFAAGQSVNVKAEVTDNNELHGVHIMVTDAVGGHLLHEENHIDVKTYSLNKTFTVAAGGQYRIEIGADDHAGNTATVVLNVTGN